jgi:aspartyl protease family protein
MISGSAASIRKANDGQYWTEARVNSTSIRFLVDTGASVVALTPLDAQKAGIRPKQLKYNAPVNTAAGQIMAAPIMLDVISVGNVTVRDVRGVVIPDGLPHSLLGMSYLGELQRVEATKTALILRQ